MTKKKIEKIYYVGIRGDSISFRPVHATSREEARWKFAVNYHVDVSSYIVTKTEKQVPEIVRRMAKPIY